MLLTVSDLERLGGAALEEFSRQAPGGRSGSETDRPATRLEAKLEQLYGIAVSMAQQEEQIDSVAGILGEMVTICDRMAGALKGSRTDAYHRILDIRNACEENRALHA
jgi:hypothetical protein